MKNLIAFVLLLAAQQVFAQQKKAVYYDQHMHPVSKKAYFNKSKKNNDLLDINYEVDSARIYTKVVRENQGTLSTAALAAIVKDLATTSGAVIDPKNIIVINYHPGKDACNSTGTQDKEFLKKQNAEYQKQLHSMGAVSQFYLYSKKEGLEKYAGTYEWKPDLNNRIKDTFFKYHYPCGSVVVIHPGGKYLAYYGEYSHDLVYKYVRQLKK